MPNMTSSQSPNQTHSPVNTSEWQHLTEKLIGSNQSANRNDRNAVGGDQPIKEIQGWERAKSADVRPKDDLSASPSHSRVGQSSPIPSGTRVFKKSSPNNKITAYLGKRDFVDHLTYTDPVDGVILVEPEYVEGGVKVWASILAAFRYGREDLDVLGLTFRKDLYLAVAQIYPPVENYSRKLTRLQERLLKKLGPNAYPFYFEIPSLAPASVILQPAPNDTGKPCGVDYELKCFAAPSLEDKPLKKSTVRLAIRKVVYAPDNEYYAGIQPHTEISKDFLMSPGPLHLEVSLDKKKYYHGEPIAVNVQITNNSNKTVKKIKIAVRQYADICLFSTAQYKCNVAELESDDGFPLGPCCNLSKVYYLTPLLNENRDKRGLALDGKLKHEDTNLASSTIFHEEKIDKSTSLSSDERVKEKENLGIIVRYTVKVKLIVAFGVDVAAELGFVLTHPPPLPSIDDEPPPPTSKSKICKVINPALTKTDIETNERHLTTHQAEEEVKVQKEILKDGNALEEPNLIEFNESRKPSVNPYDEIVFEDFARLRVQQSLAEGGPIASEISIDPPSEDFERDRENSIPTQAQPPAPLTASNSTLK